MRKTNSYFRLIMVVITIMVTLPTWAFDTLELEKRAGIKYTYNGIIGKIHYWEIFIDMDNNKKSEKELFDEEIKNWPIELEQLAEESRRKSKKLNEGITSQKEFDKYFEDCISWDEYRNKWII